jgi:hypothetical protein
LYQIGKEKKGTSVSLWVNAIQALYHSHPLSENGMTTSDVGRSHFHQSRKLNYFNLHLYVYVAQFPGIVIFRTCRK